MKKNVTDKEIMEHFGLAHWSIRCSRMRTFMNQSYHPANIEFYTHRTSDYREFRGMPYCEDLRAWLIGDLEIDGKAYSGQGSYGGQA